MKFSKQDLLTMLIGLFLFSSCKDSNTIGLDLEDGQAINAELYNGTAITSVTQRDVPANTLGLIRYPLGYMVDDFGVTESSLAISVNTAEVAPDFEKKSLIDSAILILPYNQLYGDSTNKYTITVNQLKVDLSTKKSFLSNIAWDYNKDVVLGTHAKEIYPNSKFQVKDQVKDKDDTLRTVIPQMRIKLDNAFIQQKILSLDTGTLKSNDAFMDYFKGLHLTAKVNGKGGMIFFNLKDKEAKLQVFYHKPATGTDKIQVLNTVFPIVSDNVSPIAATVKHDYSSVPAIMAQLEDTHNTQYDVTYLQPMSGLKNKISFNFTAFKTQLAGTKVSINKAELVLDVKPSQNTTYFTPSPRLVLYRYDIAGQRANVPDNDNSIQGSYSGDPRALQSEVLFGGFFDSVNGRYIFTITSYIQDLLDGKTKDYGTFIAPTPVGEFNIFPSPTTAAGVTLVKPLNSGDANTKRMKLNIYYTKVN